MAHDADDVAQGVRVRRARTGMPVTLPRRRHEPQRPGPGRRDPRRRPPPLARRRRSRTAAPRARVQAGHGARPRQPRARAGTAAGSGPTRPATDVATVGGVIANNSGGMRCGVVARLLPDRALADVRAAVGHRDRHRGAGRRGALRRAPSPSWRAGLLAIRDEIRADAELAERDPARSSRSRTRPATGCARSSTPTRRSRSSAGCSSARRARWRSSPRPCSRPCRSPPRTTTAWLLFPDIDAAAAPVAALVAAGATRGRADGRARR